MPRSVDQVAAELHEVGCNYTNEVQRKHLAANLVDDESIICALGCDAEEEFAPMFAHRTES